jgi:hypothetical protein
MHFNRSLAAPKLRSAKSTGTEDSQDRQSRCSRRTSSIVVHLDTGDEIAKKSTTFKTTTASYTSRQPPQSEMHPGRNFVGTPAMAKGFAVSQDDKGLLSKKDNENLALHYDSEIGAISQREMGLSEIQPSSASAGTNSAFNPRFFDFSLLTENQAREEAMLSCNFGGINGSAQQVQENDTIHISNSQHSQLLRAFDSPEKISFFDECSVGSAVQDSMYVAASITTIPDSQDGTKHEATTVQGETYWNRNSPEKPQTSHEFETNLVLPETAPNLSTRLNRPRRRIREAGNESPAKWDWGILGMTDTGELEMEKRISPRWKPGDGCEVKKTSSMKQTRSLKANAGLETPDIPKKRRRPANSRPQKIPSRPCHTAANQVKLKISALSNIQGSCGKLRELTADAACDQGIGSPIISIQAEIATVKNNPVIDASFVASGLKSTEAAPPQALINTGLVQLGDRAPQAPLSLDEPAHKSVEANRVNVTAIPNDNIGAGYHREYFHSEDRNAGNNMCTVTRNDKPSSIEKLRVMKNVPGHVSQDGFEADSYKPKFDNLRNQATTKWGRIRGNLAGTFSRPVVPSEIGLCSSDQHTPEYTPERSLVEKRHRISRQISQFMSQLTGTPHVEEPQQEVVGNAPEGNKTVKLEAEASHKPASDGGEDERIGGGRNRTSTEEIKDKTHLSSISSKVVFKEDRQVFLGIA